MRQVRLIYALALLLGAALAVSACGGDSTPETPIVISTDASTGTTGSLTKDEFIQEADALCGEANAAIGQFVAAGQGFTEAGEIADLRQGLLDDIRDLGAPSEDRQTLDAYLTALETQAEAGKKIDLANQRGSDTAAFETELDNARTEAETAAAEYGFEECGAQPTATSGSTDTGSSGGTVAPSTPVTPVEPAPSDTGGTGGDTGGTGDTGGDTGGGTGGGVSPGGGGVSP